MVARRAFLKLTGAAGLALLNGGAVIQPSLWSTKEPVVNPLREQPLDDIAQFGEVTWSTAPFSELQRVDPALVDGVCDRMVARVTEAAHRGGYTIPHSDGVWIEVHPGGDYDDPIKGYTIGYKQSFRREVMNGAEARAAT